LKKQQQGSIIPIVKRLGSPKTRAERKTGVFDPRPDLDNANVGSFGEHDRFLPGKSFVRPSLFGSAAGHTVTLGIFIPSFEAGNRLFLLSGIQDKGAKK